MRRLLQSPAPPAAACCCSRCCCTWTCGGCCCCCACCTSTHPESSSDDLASMTSPAAVAAEGEALGEGCCFLALLMSWSWVESFSWNCWRDSWKRRRISFCLHGASPRFLLFPHLLLLQPDDVPAADEAPPGGPWCPSRWRRAERERKKNPIVVSKQKKGG